MFGRKLRDSGGDSVEILDPGRQNFDSGPDFFNSKLKIGGVEWAGNVEIHVKASDWYRHGHDSDPAYDSVILHAVGVSDRRVARADGSLIPQVEILMPEDFYRTFRCLSENRTSVRCSDSISSIPALAVTDWLETLSVERIQAKANRIAGILKSTGGDWEQACFVSLSRGLGFSLNGDPFEMLARSLPLKILAHHSDNPLQLQALLFGQAGMLDSSNHIFDEFYQSLCREYYFLARKYGLRPMRGSLWKYSRTRPQNFPHRRIALLAKICEGGFSLFSRIRDVGGDVDKARELFHWSLDGYWHSHFSFDVEARMSSDSLSGNSVDLLIINVVAPLIYAYGGFIGDPDFAESAFDILDRLPAEENVILREWRRFGLPAGDARRSQALIQLRKEYCDAGKCLFCRFGHQILKRCVTADEPGKLKMEISG